MKKMMLLLMFLTIPATLSAQTIKIVFEEWPPYQFTQNDKVVGTDTEIVEAVCQRLGISPQFRSVPWARALQEIRDGQADAIFSLAYTDERNEFLIYPDHPINTMQTVLFVKKENPLEVSRLHDLDGLRISVVRDNFYGEEFGAYTGASKIPTSDQKTQFKLLINNRVDVVVSDKLVGKQVAQESGYDDQIKTLDYVVTKEFLYIGFSKAKGEVSQELAQQFSDVLMQLHEEGIIDRILQTYHVK